MAPRCWFFSGILVAGLICVPTVRAEQLKTPKKESKAGIVIDDHFARLEADLQELQALVDRVQKARERAGRGPALPLSENTNACWPRGLAQSIGRDVTIYIYGYVKSGTVDDFGAGQRDNYVFFVDQEERSRRETGARENRGMAQAGGGNFESTTQTNRGPSGVLIWDESRSGRAQVDERADAGFPRLEWEAEGFSILAGWTTEEVPLSQPLSLDVTLGISSLVPSGPRPHLRITRDFSIFEGLQWRLDVATESTTSWNGLFDSGIGTRPQALSTLKARESISFPLLWGKTTTIGLSGHWAVAKSREEFTKDQTSIDAWSLNLDVHVPVTDEFTLKGAAFLGKNPGILHYGVFTGIDEQKLGDVRKRGGWVAASIGPLGNWRFSLGGALQDVNDGDVEDSDSTYNATIFGNTIYSISDRASFGIELSRWYTDYKSVKDGDSIRIQTSFIYKF